MTVDELIAIANQGYPDDLILRAHQGEEVGDTLALFIALELKETLEPQMGRESQLEEAWNRLDTARGEIEAVMETLNHAADNTLDPRYI